MPYLSSATKKHKTLVRCAVAKYRYNFYGVQGDNAWHWPSPYDLYNGRLIPKLFFDSDYVWREGPQGGVKLVRQNGWTMDKYKPCVYITQNEEEMKEFAWIKLRAKTVTE